MRLSGAVEKFKQEDLLSPDQDEMDDYTTSNRLRDQMYGTSIGSSRKSRRSEFDSDAATTRLKKNQQNQAMHVISESEHI